MAFFYSTLIMCLFTVVVSSTILAAVDGGDAAPGPSLADNKQQLDQIVARLTKTKALGLLAKLSLKGDLNKFLAETANIHKGKSKTTIEQLEEHFHVLVTKLVASVQKKDPQLAKDISAFRDALWIVVADAEAFAAL